ncbi:MAG: FKBP-type peptidyl-prolyl cis-trans isomerase, partial [Ilumatobacteraceae bacterium]
PPVTADDAPIDIDIPPSVGATEVTVTEVVAGDGAVAEPGDTVVIHLLLVRGDNQVVIVNTWEASDPLQIILAEGQTIPGLYEGLLGAQVGSTLAIAMPPELAFGEQGEPTLGLPAGVDAIAVVEVVGVY